MKHNAFLEKLLQGTEVEWKTLGEVFNLKNGYTPSKSNKDFWENGTIPWFRMEDIRTNGRILDKALQKVSKSAVKGGKLFPANSIMLSTTATIGEHALIKTDYLTNQQLTNFIIKETYKNSLDIKFCFYYFFIISEEIKTMVGNANLPIISIDKLKKLQIPIPPLSVQQEIVKILDTLTALTSELTSELTLRQKQYQYYRDKLLTFGDEVEWKTLGEVCENLDSKRKPITSGLREKGDIPYYGASGIVDYVKDYIFDGDYLLVSEDGANLLARNTPIAFSISGKNWVNNHAHVLKFENDTERKFIEFYLNNLDLTPYISGAAQPKLNKQNLNSIRIPNLSLEAKTKIVDILDKFDSLTNSISEGLPKEIELRNKQYEYYREMLLGFERVSR